MYSKMPCLELVFTGLLWVRRTLYSEWRKPWVNEVLRECAVYVVLTILRSPSPQAWRGGKAFLRESSVSVDSVCRKSTIVSLLGH